MSGFKYLAKACKEEHMPGNTPSLKLGSVMEYRNSDQVGIGDEMEGRYLFDFVFVIPTWVDISWFKVFTFGCFDIGGCSDGRQTKVQMTGKTTQAIDLADHAIAGTGKVDLEQLRVSSIFEGRMLIEGTLRISIEPANSLIFSTVLARERNVVPSEIESSYDSVWYLPVENVPEFASIVLRHLQNTARLENLTHQLLGGFQSEREGVQFGKLISQRSPKVLSELPVDIENLDIKLYRADIEYEPKKFVVTSQRDWPWERLKSVFKAALFVKNPDDFCHQKEHRFCYYPVLNGHPLRFPDFLKTAEYVPFSCVDHLLVY